MLALRRPRNTKVPPELPLGAGIGGRILVARVIAADSVDDDRVLRHADEPRTARRAQYEEHEDHLDGA
jgi:hypothetical protein